MGIKFSHTRDPERMSTADTDQACDVMEGDKESEDEFQEAQETPRNYHQEMIDFRQELATKREQRRRIIAKHSMEKENLRKSLLAQVQANEGMTEENKYLRELLQKHRIEVPESLQTQPVAVESPISVLMEDLDSLKEHNKKLQKDLEDTNMALQSANSDMDNLKDQNGESMKQINALKEIVAVSKTMMQIRESQLNELKAKLSQIEASLADREADLLSTDLRAEYERQLQNIRTLRALYEERARLGEVSRGQLARDLEEQKRVAAAETNRCKELTDKVQELEAKMSEMTDAIDVKDDQISLTREETRGLKAEMTTVNKLFSQMLLGYRSQQDLDKLVSRLQEHHGLLAHMVTQDGAEASALPKLLLDLVGQVDQDKCEEKRELANETSLNTTAEEIVDNLPKVWRVLMELLSHQSAGEKGSQELHPSTCYKPVETTSGTRMVPSVSQTYIRLKDLIVEKLSLTKDMNKMKQLNAHLESRLEEQERRLGLVTSELSKTWHVVGKLRRHHHQLHTHEKILRYELQQKRKMLNELKEELEYCKEKWDKAREKNCESEKEWTKLRNELSERHKKLKQLSHNSGESGYSDERQTEDDFTESNDESESSSHSPVRCKKRLKKSVNLFSTSKKHSDLDDGQEKINCDSLDVSDIPLDEFDVEEKEDESSTSESHLNENVCEKEVCNKPDSFNSSTETEEVCLDKLNKQINENTGTIEGIQLTDNFEITGNERLHTLEKSCESLNCQTAKVSDLRKQIEYKNQNIKKTEPFENLTNDITLNQGDKPPHETNFDRENVASPSCSHTINPKAILENIKKQNERLTKRDERMKRLEESCKSLLQASKTRVELGSYLEDQIDEIHSERAKNVEVCTKNKGNTIDVNTEIQGGAENNVCISEEKIKDFCNLGPSSCSNISNVSEKTYKKKLYSRYTK